jgi:T5SS/PEP-CTERM-associated repeat protein
MSGRRRRVFVLAALAAAAGGICAGRLAASDNLWVNPLGGSFHDGGNWDVGVPGPLDHAIFDLGSLLPYVVSISSDVSNNQLRVGNDQLQLAFTPGATYSLTSASASVPAIVVGDLISDAGNLNLVNATIATPGLLVVGAEGNGTLSIPATSRVAAGDVSVGVVGNGHLFLQGGGIFTSNGTAIIGRGTGGEGTVVLDQSGTSWNNGGTLNVGLNGNGLLQVSGGAVVNGTGATVGGDAVSGAAGSGAVVLSGANSKWNIASSLIVGGGGVGNVAVGDGAKLINGSAIVGEAVGSTGTVHLEDSGTSWTTSGAVRIANNGSGDVTVEAGASGSSGALDVGINAAGNLAVTGSGSSWTSNGDMRVGVGHFGTLTIDSGGAVVSPSATVGSAEGAIGQVLVNNGSTWSNPGVLNVGRGGADGFVALDHGAQLSSGPTNVGGDGAAGSGNGAVFVRTGSHWTAGAVALGLGGTGDLEVMGGGVVDAASLVISNGPAASVGSVKVDGSTLRVSGPLEVGHDGTGTLNVINGSSVASLSGAVGSLASGSGTVTIDSIGSWNIGANLDVGVNGAAILNVNNGRVGAANGFVGRGASGTGTANFSGNTGQFALSDSLYIGGDSVGQQGNGTVSIGAGSTLSASNQVKIWATGTLSFDGTVSTALIDLQGGLLNGNGSLNSTVTSTNGRIATSGALTLSGPLSIETGSNLTKQGTGTLNIVGAQNHGAGATLNVAGGSVLMASNAGTPASGSGAALTPLKIHVSGSNVTLGVDQDLQGLSVDFANSGSQSFNLASPSGLGAFRSVRVYSPDLAAAKSAIYAAMRNANVAGAADPTDGIYDSGLSSHANAKLGIARLSDAHGDPYLLIRPTRIGDLNLDGAVTISDFIDLASNFNGVNKTWQEGDLNYDGAVTISDFIDLASNFNGAYSGLVQGGGSQSEPYDILAEFAASLGVDPSVIGTAVPEPGCVAIVGVAASLLATRRRRR